MYKDKDIKFMEMDAVSGIANEVIGRSGKSMDDRHFVIMPVKILDYSDTASVSSVEERHDKDVYVEEDCFYALLFKYVYWYFDKNTRENNNRDTTSISDTNDKNLGFEICGAYNFFTHEHIKGLIEDLQSSIWKFNDVTKDFFSKFINRMKEMIEWSKANGFSLISIHAASTNPDEIDPRQDYLRI